MNSQRKLAIHLDTITMADSLAQLGAKLYVDKLITVLVRLVYVPVSNLKLPNTFTITLIQLYSWNLNFIKITHTVFQIYDMETRDKWNNAHCEYSKP